ncbi:MAG: HdeD family acid-resistance protein [Chitinispirillaceae bacterium]
MDQNMAAKEEKTYSRLKNWSLVLGIAMITLGLVTITMASITTLFTIFLLGIILTVRGGIDTVFSLVIYRQKRFWHQLSGGILSLVIGVIILLRPEVTAAVITFLIATFLIAGGLFRTIAAPVEHESQWGWVMLGGLVSLLLGIWIMGGWPAISVWLIGLLLGVEILVHGMVLVTLPYALRQIGGHGGEAFAR